MSAIERVAKVAYEEMIRRQGYDPQGMGPVALLSWESQSEKLHADWIAVLKSAVLAERERIVAALKDEMTNWLLVSKLSASAAVREAASNGCAAWTVAIGKIVEGGSS